MAGVPRKKKGPTPEAIGQPSDEYRRFKAMMKRLVRVPKRDVDARREAEQKRA